MKKILILTLCMVALTISCTKQVQVIDEPLVPISLGGGASIDTKAPVYNSTGFHAQVLGTTDDTTATATYPALYTDQQSTTFNKDVTFAVQVNTDPCVGSYTGPVYYPVQTSTLVYFKGYSPEDQAAVNTGDFSVSRSTKTVTFSNITGHQDIMISDQQSGNRSKSDAVKLKFGHYLSQVIFKVAAENLNSDEGAAAIAAWGNVTKLEVLSQYASFTVNLQTNAWATSGNADNTFIAYSNATGQALTTTATQLGTASDNNGILMVNPTTDDWTIKVYTAKNGNAGLEVTIPHDLLMQYAHEITLTFKANAIQVSAVVVPWVTGTNYSSDVI